MQIANLSNKQICGSVDKIFELKLSPLSFPEPLGKPTLKYTRVLEFQLEVKISKYKLIKVYIGQIKNPNKTENG